MKINHKKIIAATPYRYVKFWNLREFQRGLANNHFHTKHSAKSTTDSVSFTLYFPGHSLQKGDIPWDGVSFVYIKNSLSELILIKDGAKNPTPLPTHKDQLVAPTQDCENPLKGFKTELLWIASMVGVIESILSPKTGNTEN